MRACVRVRVFNIILFYIIARGRYFVIVFARARYNVRLIRAIRDKKRCTCCVRAAELCNVLHVILYAQVRRNNITSTADERSFMYKYTRTFYITIIITIVYYILYSVRALFCIHMRASRIGHTRCLRKRKKFPSRSDTCNARAQ